MELTGVEESVSQIPIYYYISRVSTRNLPRSDVSGSCREAAIPEQPRASALGEVFNKRCPESISAPPTRLRFGEGALPVRRSMWSYVCFLFGLAKSDPRALEKRAKPPDVFSLPGRGTRAAPRTADRGDPTSPSSGRKER
jgi:hypothetical protein